MTVSWFPVILTDIVGSVLSLVLAVCCTVTAHRWIRKNPDDVFRQYISLLTLAIMVFAISRSFGHLIKQLLILNGMNETWQAISPFSGAINTATFVVSFAFAIIYHRFQKIHDEVEEYRHDLEGIITARTNQLREANSELERERERLSVTLHSIADGVISTGVDGRVILMNPVAERLTGWPGGQARGRHLREIFRIEGPARNGNGMGRIDLAEMVIEGKEIVTIDGGSRLVGRDGSIHEIECSGAPVFDTRRKVVGAVVVFRDVTDRRRTEQELLKVEKLRSVGVLAGGIAHDFNNILTVILGNIELAQMRCGHDEGTMCILDNAAKATFRAKDLTKQLLTFAKGGDPVRRTASIAEVVEESARFALHGSNCKCHFSKDRRLPLVKIDTGQISQVIHNVVLNAKEAMPQGGTIAVSCTEVSGSRFPGLLEPDQKYVEIVVEDTGTGIAEEDLARIFDPYFTTKETGHGLGLAICHSVVRGHGGHMSVDSRSGSGTRVSIYLPVSPEIGKEDSIRPESVSQGQAAAVQPRRCTHGGEEGPQGEGCNGTILIMDDEEMIREVVAEVLEARGYRVLHAEDGRSAIEIFRQALDRAQKIDLVIMDLTIPGGMGGREAARHILSLDPEATLVVASGYSDDPILADCTRFGFAAAINKPFTSLELIHLVERLCPSAARGV